MAHIALSDEDRRVIAETLEELDPASHELLARFREVLNDSDWAFAVGYVTARIRGALEIGLIARAVVAAAERNGLADERGSDHFLRSKAWLHNFGVPQTGDEYFYAVSAAAGGGLVRAHEALLELAQDHLFGTFDDEYQRLFSTGA